MAPYRPRPIKGRRRRSAAEMQEIRDRIYAITSAMRPMSVRQVFYQLTTQGVIEKTESEYKQTVIRLLGEMRLNDDLPFSWIADNSRWMRKPDTHSSLKSGRGIDLRLNYG